MRRAGIGLYNLHEGAYATTVTDKQSQLVFISVFVRLTSNILSFFFFFFFFFRILLRLAKYIEKHISEVFSMSCLELPNFWPKYIKFCVPNLG